jgi:hypothetical protein
VAHQSDDRIDSASTCPRHLLRQSVRPEPLQEHTFTVRAWSIRIMLKRGTLAERAPRPPRLRGCVSIAFCVFMTQASSSCQRLPQSRVDSFGRLVLHTTPVGRETSLSSAVPNPHLQRSSGPLAAEKGRHMQRLRWARRRGAAGGLVTCAASGLAPQGAPCRGEVMHRMRPPASTSAKGRQTLAALTLPGRTPVQTDLPGVAPQRARLTS